MDTAKLQNLLLTFEGRIGPMSLMQGTVVIFAVNFILQILSMVISFIGLLAIVLLYPMFCIYAKRFHDGGKPAVWTLAVLGGMIVANIVIGGLIATMFISSAVTTGGVGGATLGMVIMGIISAAIVQFGAAFIVNQFVKGDPAPNAYGEPPVDATSMNPLS
ncbi:DUF805 domain-containing protein [Hyphobacterium sp. CCMP332]|uniref:DUF805 domain-containing protein n=1 Tax=Hyphobacterium sp. CCMP332 TaxID=2749086 RepID=UPI0016508437|nr:DUF805 domain-containing protein [Hyphobacterium sp. CCMP332]QNL18947.1 DUF805 domain-containing protein [Hyphobacterium sp. CCMP332]